jgi:hypothetical protein
LLYTQSGAGSMLEQACSDATVAVVITTRSITTAIITGSDATRAANVR